MTFGLLASIGCFAATRCSSESYARVLGTTRRTWCFADPPYNVPVDGHASGLGAIKHADFVMASGELSSAEFQSFLRTSLGHAASRSIDGAIHYVCMDWRHQREIIGGRGSSLQRTQELVRVEQDQRGDGLALSLKARARLRVQGGKGAHINNVALGRFGRHRTNVWDYVSQNALTGPPRASLPCTRPSSRSR